MARSVGKKIIWGVIIIVLAIQFVPVNRDNPPITAAINAPVDFSTIIKRSCYDCHSNETEWPWYSFIAPASWLIASDVHDGRKHLNFSTWEDLTQERRLIKAEEIWDEVSDGEMPLGIYLIMHSDASLSDSDKEVIKTWSANYGIPVSRPDVDSIDTSSYPDNGDIEDDD